MFARALPLDPLDVLVVDPFDGALGLVSRDGREVVQEIVDGAPVLEVAQ